MNVIIYIFIYTGFYSFVFFNCVVRIIKKESVNKYIKNTNKKFGNCLVLFMQKYVKRKNYIFSIILSILFLFGSIIMLNYYLSISLSLAAFSFVALMTIKDNYININGVYENGILSYTFIPWNEIHSFKIKNSKTLEILKNDGSNIDIENIDNITEVIKIMDSLNSKI